jgi:hypothetical protein
VQALALLAAHDRRFPDGVLRAERTASFVEAYCALGREVDARREARRLARTAPGNLALLDRLRRGCAASVLDDIAGVGRVRRSASG